MAVKRKKECNRTAASTINKDDFIDFLANASPDEINKLILERGKPAKLIEPMVYFKNKKPLDNDKQ